LTKYNSNLAQETCMILSLIRYMIEEENGYMANCSYGWSIICK
jgi:hypothetical protein